MSHVADDVAARCASCREPLSGAYCARCGEKVLDPESLTIRHFVTHTLADELVHLDGRFWRTLRALILRPGVLSEEYSAGRRRLYIRPIKLLIASIITNALATQGGLLVTLTIGWLNLSIAPTTVATSEGVAETVRRIDRFGILRNVLAEKATSTDLTSDAVRERFHRRLNQFAQPLSFANVLLLAASLYLMFRRRRPLLLDHAVFSIHLVSFVLISSLTLVPGLWILPFAHGAAVAIFFAVSVWQFAYIAVALRRFYFKVGPRVARPGTYATVIALAIYILNSAFITCIQMLGGAIALRAL